jgi:FdhE protein
MALVALQPATRGSRLAEASSRWAALAAARPDLEPAVALQRQLIGLVVDLAEAIERGRLPRLALPPRYVAAKLARGVPALAGEPIPLPVALVKPALIRLCEALSAGGAGAAADNIKTAILETRLDAGSLLTASLSRDQAAIRTGAVHRGLAPDLVWLVAELAISPFAHALQRVVFPTGTAGTRPDGASQLNDALANWNHGFCPACGSWPAIAEVVSGRRGLRCSFCAYAWEMHGARCIYCGESGEPFTAAAANPQREDRRLELCSACRSYMKSVDVPEWSPFPLIAIADLETMDLDMAAIERGFSRPPLKDFSTRA